MQLEFLLEEASAEEALKRLLPRLLPEAHTVRYRVHEGCQDLLKRLPNLLQGYARRIQREGQHDLRVVVLLDADTKGTARKQALEQYAAAAGLRTKTARTAPDEAFWVLNRIAVEELEAWFLGDRAAVRAAYPRLHPNHFKGLERNPDAVAKSATLLLQLLQKAGYFGTGKRKREWAAVIAPHLSLVPGANASGSFACFCEGLRALR